MMTTKKPDNANGKAPGAKFQTSIFFTEDMLSRLMKYILHRGGGRMHMRNKILMEALDEKLKREGF